MLAAGAATRFGGNKLAAIVDGLPILTRVVSAFLGAGVGDVIVVLGAREGELRPLVPPPARTVLNERWETSMFSSVLAGLSALRRGDGPVAITPGDLAWLQEDTILRVLGAPGEGVVVPTCDGRRGHPMVLSRALVRRVLSWPDTARLSDLLYTDGVRVDELPGFDDRILRDVDTLADLA